ncbi:MAG TPA: serine hydrolase [Flavisolibacter sp.]|nr:serine hydrolase [Flavisolibacter sp.]
MRKLCLLFLLFASAIYTGAQPSFVKDSLDGYVQKALTGWHIPGVAVCIVKDGKIEWMKGYGVAELGTDKKVDENTLFGIGSNTKAFTATALALLAAEKKLSLDDKVQKWLPDFQLYDPWVAKEATIRDLLCHRLGFETFQGDFMFFDSDLTVAQVREKLSKVKPLYSFRSKWGYTNAAFLTAGEIIPKATGKTWAQLLKERIFTPLGMTRTLAMSSEIPGASNMSAAHTVVKGVTRKVPYGKLENIGPAGSISSSIADLSKWLLMLLGDGKLNNTTIIPESAITETRTPHSILGDGGHFYNKAHFALYGLGWMLEEYSGRKIVAHTGGVNGFVTSVCLVPEEKLGIVVLTNTDANNFFEALRYEIMDAYLGLPYRNYSNVYLGFHESREKRQEAAEKQWKDTVAMNVKPVVPLQAFTGTYTHSVYGTMNVAIKNAKLIATFQHHKGRYAELEHLGSNRFLASFNDPILGIKIWPFTIAGGKVKSATVSVADFVEFLPYEFVKTN